jgi:ring-1,2-phenylacetyl-CoA epoxidase subunit PaaB
VTDTQWPRFEVFVQESPGKPHVHAGSVHATDSEIALLNARDVFVRRPDCVSLWVVPASAVTESAGAGVRGGGLAPTGEIASPLTDYLVFGKLEQKGVLTHLGRVQGRGRAEAMRAAEETFADRKPIVLWLVPDRAVERSRESDSSSLFEPARDKPFRDQAYYHIQTALRRLRREGRGDP